MATKYISELTSVSTISNSDVFVIDDGEHNYKVPWSVIKSLLGSVSAFSVDNTAGTITLTTAAGETFTVTPHDPTKQNLLQWDTAPTEGSTKPVTSGGIFTALAAKLNASAFVAFRAATTEAAGEAGIVPAPAAGDLRYLGSDGQWHEDTGGGGGGGTTDYADLDNKPQIGGVTLTGNKTAAQLGLVAAEAGKGLSTNDFTTALKTVLDALSALVVAANNGKVLGIVNGALAAVDPSSVLPDGDEVNY